VKAGEEHGDHNGDEAGADELIAKTNWVET